MQVARLAGGAFGLNPDLTPNQADTAIKKILVVRYRFIGDTILTLPFIANLKKHYPEAKIDVLVGPVSGEVLEHNPAINQLIVFDTTRFHKYDSGKGRTRSLVSYLIEIRKKHYDMVFVLKRSLTSRLIAFASGATHRIGYVKRGKSPLLTRSVPFDQSIHEVDSLLSVLEAANIPVIDRKLEAFVTQEEVGRVLALAPGLPSARGAKQPQRFILIHAAAAHPDKLYPLANWGDLIDLLLQRSEITIVFSGDKQDLAIYKSLKQIVQQKGHGQALDARIIDLSGQLSLRESLALYSLLDLGICTDSGPSHMLSAMQTPTLTLFGPTDPVRWGPYGDHCQALYREDLECRPCHYRKVCDDRPCLTQLSPAFIFEKCLNILDR